MGHTYIIFFAQEYIYIKLFTILKHKSFWKPVVTNNFFWLYGIPNVLIILGVLNSWFARSKNDNYV